MRKRQLKRRKKNNTRIFEGRHQQHNSAGGRRRIAMSVGPFSKRDDGMRSERHLAGELEGTLCETTFARGAAGMGRIEHVGSSSVLLRYFVSFSYLLALLLGTRKAQAVRRQPPIQIRIQLTIAPAAVFLQVQREHTQTY